MQIESEYSEQKSLLTIKVKGEFDFSCLNDFRRTFVSGEFKQVDNVVVDFRDAVMVDSSALGMLLNMQIELGKADREIKIINSNDAIRSIFKMTNFNKKFDVV